MAYLGTHPIITYATQSFSGTSSGTVIYPNSLSVIYQVGDHGATIDSDYDRIYLDKDIPSIFKLWMVDINFYSFPVGLEYICLAGNEMLTSGISGSAMYRYQDAKNKYADTHFQFIGSFKFLTRFIFYGNTSQTNARIMIRRL